MGVESSEQLWEDVVVKSCNYCLTSCAFWDAPLSKAGVKCAAERQSFPASKAHQPGWWGIQFGENIVGKIRPHLLSRCEMGVHKQWIFEDLWENQKQSLIYLWNQILSLSYSLQEKFQDSRGALISFQVTRLRSTLVTSDLRSPTNTKHFEKRQNFLVVCLLKTHFMLNLVKTRWQLCPSMALTRPIKKGLVALPDWPVSPTTTSSDWDPSENQLMSNLSSHRR